MIRAQGLVKRFGDRSALDGATFRVKEGSIFGYLGPNGAGKTTTLHVLLGLIAPTAGTAVVADIDVAHHPGAVRRRCGALLEHHGLYERLSAAENLEFYGRLHGLSPQERSLRIRELLDGMGLWERRQERVGTWSRGMKQRLAIARALLHRPQVLFLDEPTAGFDPTAAAKLRAELREAVRQDGLTVFLTTHNLQEAQGMCDEVAVLRDGRVVAQGHPDSLRGGDPQVDVVGSRFKKALAALRAHDAVREVQETEVGLRLTLRTTKPMPELVRLMVAAGAQIDEVRRLRLDLETAFLQLMDEPAVPT